MILYGIYNIVIHVTFLFLTLSVLFGTMIENDLRALFYNKTIRIRELLDNEVYIEDKKVINDRWWKTLYVLNGVFITTSVIMTGLLSYVSKKKVLKILISNTINSIIVLIIQLFIIEYIKFSSLGPVGFELIILDELKNKL